jgi:hypothetical protein
MNRGARSVKTMLGIAAIEGLSILAVISMLGALSYSGQKRDLESAERTAMEAQARAMGDAFQSRLANLLAQGKESEIEVLARTNPVEWLSVPPRNYIGNWAKAPAYREALGAWYFDESAGELVYHLRRGERFVPDAAGHRRVRFHIELVRVDRGGASETFGAVFRPVEMYRWR